VIYLNEESENRQAFENLLQRSKDLTLAKLAFIEKPSALSGAEFELIVYDVTVEVSSGTPFEGKLVHTADREFPDIVAAGFFGVEVKATKKDDWTSIGNSVLESSRFPSVEKIYMFFGKLGGAPNIIFRDYEDCLKGVAVTHYPRYQIDMKLEAGKSIFHEMGIDYATLRQSSTPVKQIRAYYKSRLKEGDALWWIEEDQDQIANSSPIVRNFASLSPEQRDVIKVDVFTQFPEVFSSSNKKFERVPAHLAVRYGVVTANLRDHFTAGGQTVVEYEGEEAKVPQIFGEALRLSTQIAANLSEKTETDLSQAWNKRIENFESFLKAWLNEIDRYSTDLGLNVSAARLFENELAKR
jgi:hypothetical protein